MVRRWILTAVVAAVLVVAAVFAAHAIRDDNTDSAARAIAITTSSTTTGPPGPCGTDAGAIRGVIDAAVSGAVNADMADCRLAAADPSWAAVHLAPKPGAQFAAVTVIVHRGAGSWTVVAQGGPSAGCGQAPQQVIVDLGQSCTGTGGGAR